MAGREAWRQAGEVGGWSYHKTRYGYVVVITTVVITTPPSPGTYVQSQGRSFRLVSVNSVAHRNTWASFETPHMQACLGPINLKSLGLRPRHLHFLRLLRQFQWALEAENHCLTLPSLICVSTLQSRLYHMGKVRS